MPAILYRMQVLKSSKANLGLRSKISTACISITRGKMSVRKQSFLSPIISKFW